MNNAKKAKNDEFYTQLEDIEKELIYYKDSLKGKKIYCNCDDYRFSNFVKYFKDNFQELQIKQVTATNLDNGKGAYKYAYDGNEEIITELRDNGDFRSEECIDILEESDIIVTNPPFSLFREYISQLTQHNKHFLVLGNMNAITYKEFFPHIKNNKVWLGVTTVKAFVQTNKEIKKFGNITWYTNMPHQQRSKPLELTKQYTPQEYPHYDNYDAINVDKVKDIPKDYYGVMGVPISFLPKYCPQQFEIIRFRKGEDNNDLVYTRERERERERETPYFRILIQRLK